MATDIKNDPPTSAVDPGTAVTLSSAAATWTIASGISGDTDGDYEITGEVILPSDGVNASLISFQPNGISANQVCRQLADGSASDITDLRIGGASDAAGAQLNFRIVFKSKTGKNRYYWCTCRRKVNTGPGFLVYVQQGLWTDTSTAVTSLVLSSSYAGAGGLGIISGTAQWRKLGFTA
jgi:hypothetical protein